MYSDQAILSHEPFLYDSVDGNHRRYQIKRLMPITTGICLLVFLLLLTLILVFVATRKQQTSSVTTTQPTTSSRNITTILTTTTSIELNTTGNYLCV